MSSSLQELNRELKRYETMYDREQRFKMVRERSGISLVLYVEALVEKYGPEIYDVLGNVSREFAYTRYSKIINQLGIKEQNAIAAVKLISYVHTIGGIKGEVIEASPEKSVRIERECPMKDIYTYEMCKNIISLPALQGICKALGGNVVVSHPKYMARGDDVCEFVFEMKG